MRRGGDGGNGFTNVPFRAALCGALAGALFVAGVTAQDTMSPDLLLQPLGDSWPMHNGDYSGRRFSTLAAIDASNVKALSLAWVHRVNPGPAPAGGGGATSAIIKGTRVVVTGVLDPAKGVPLWHSGLDTSLTNGPITYALDGTQ